MKIKFKPDPALSDVVEYYWLLRLSPDYFNASSKLVLPSTSVNLVFNLGAGHDLIPVHSNQINACVRHSPLLLGQKKTGVTITNTKNGIHLLGVRCYPNKLYRLIRMPLHHITESGANMEDLLKSRKGETQRILAQETPIEQKLLLIERLLKENLKPHTTKTNATLMVDHAVNIIKTKKGNVKIYDLQKAFNISKKALQYKFLHQIGLLPKEFARIVRMNHVLDLASTTTMSLTQISYEANYSDQSHFIRDFKSFTGIPPKQFFAQKHPADPTVTPNQFR